jgi:hypothetical protein
MSLKDEGRKERKNEGTKEGRKNKDPAPCRSSNRFVCGIIQVLSFGTFVNGNAMASGVGHTVRSNGFGRAI